MIPHPRDAAGFARTGLEFHGDDMPRSVSLLLLPLLLAGASLASAQQIRVATYNVENFREHFVGHALSQKPPMDNPPPQIVELLENERRQNNEDNWEVAQVILDPGFSPDILVLQEAADKADLEFFNRRWLNSLYETVVVFPTNTNRDQHLAIMLKKGFRIVEQRDRYHLEKDPVGNPVTDRLFARGPAFVLVETPSGYRFWVGNTHQKSKSGNDVPSTQWRNREARRTHEIMLELSKTTGVNDVLLLGDFNDALGIQEFEAEGGGDTIANNVGDPSHGFLLLTRPLAEQGKVSFGGYWNEDRRSFIDHAIATPSMKNQVVDVKVIDTPWAKVASDHFPVMVTITPDRAR
jgi:endonuclease/exonuclease/phosphatase family metal-dependent hydrolase